MEFRRDDILLVKPADGDDPDAMARAGQRCQFIRYADAPGKLSTYCVVRFSEQGKPVFMRGQDLVREEATQA